MITKIVIFAFLTGLFSVPVIIGAVAWLRDAGLQMNWWKWMLTAIWYVLFLLLVFAAFTFMGEGEISAGWRTIGVSVFIMVLLGTGLVRLILRGKHG